MAIFGMIAFSIGLMAGISALKRKSLSLAIKGIMVLLLLNIALLLLTFSVFAPYTYSLLLYDMLEIAEIPMFILSILGLIFIAKSKGDFVIT
jgi:hypothetical protein